MSPPRLEWLWSAPACGAFSPGVAAHPSTRGACTSRLTWTSFFRVPERRSSSTQPWPLSDSCERRISTFIPRLASMSSFLPVLSESATTTESNRSRFAPVERGFFCSLRRTRAATDSRASIIGMIARGSRSPCESRHARMSTWKRSKGGANRSERFRGLKSFWKNWTVFDGGHAGKNSRTGALAAGTPPGGSHERRSTPRRILRLTAAATERRATAALCVEIPGASI